MRTKLERLSVVYESQFKRLVQHFGKQSYWLCCLESDEMTDTDLSFM